jgi:hypothetical protein
MNKDMRWMAVALSAGLLTGCAQTPAEREAALKAWEARDMERARECLRTGGQWVASTCVYGGGVGR